MISIAAVLTVVDNTPLGAFPWGEEVVYTVNAYLDSGSQLTEADQGGVLIERINALPPEIRSFLLTRMVDCNELKLQPTHAPAPPPLPETLAPEETFPIGYLSSYRPVVTFIIAAGLVFIAGIMCVSIHTRAEHARGMPPSETNIVVRYGADLLRTLSRDMTKESQRKSSEGHPEVTPAKDTPAPTGTSPGASTEVRELSQ